MIELSDQTFQHICGLLDRFRDGDDSVRNELLEFANADERLQRRARTMLRRDRVHRWADTDELRQHALLRLNKALLKVKPRSPGHLLYLASKHINYALLDLAKKFFGPQGIGKHHSTDKISLGGDGRHRHEKRDSTNDPRNIFNWVVFHEQVNALPKKEREVFRLRWYGGYKCVDIARLQGTSTETAERAWSSARKLLRKAMDGKSPAS